ncbi:hypothetical protein [Macrococcus epidermidis]|uniref:hypothetical protein n=1 Tax=Macrococcus epidermidis TaxID=1902580 RepID=UPI0020B8B1DC|nr:hypothetical protein [Macrococcus epidermidis]UTH15207.1 hypothetical protein KFV12_07695 [Macrococcus epidermidis]
MNNDNIIDLKDIKNLNNKHIESFKNISYDDSNGVYLVKSLENAYNFDKLHFDYCQRKNCNATKTPDSIYCTSNTYHFIEFRNMDALNKDFFEDIRLKMIEGIENLINIFIECNVFNRRSDIHNYPMKFVLVYSKEKYDEKVNKISERSNRQARFRYTYRNHQALLEKMNQYKGYPFKDIILISNEDFDDQFVPQLIMN